jgi:hypothetical protein
VKVRQASANVLPRPLAQAQYVDYTSADKQAVIGLTKSITAMPAETPLPEPLPSEPKLPTAPLHEAKARVDSTRDLTRPKQLDLLDRLQHAFQIDDQREDAHELLVQFRNRPDIFADVRDRVDAVLAQVGKPSSSDISAGEAGPAGAETFKVSYWSLTQPGESGWKQQWSKFRDVSKQKKGELVVEPGRLRFGDEEDQLKITSVTGCSLEPVIPGVNSVVVAYDDGQRLAVSTGGVFGLDDRNRKLMQAIQRAFGLSEDREISALPGPSE